MAKHPLYCFVWEDQSVAAFLNKRFQPSGGPGSCLMQLHLLLPKRHPCAKTQTWHWCGSAWLEAVFAIIYIYISISQQGEFFNGKREGSVEHDTSMWNKNSRDPDSPHSPLVPASSLPGLLARGLLGPTRSLYVTCWRMLQ